MFRAKSWKVFFIAGILFLMAGCAQQMADQPKAKALTASDFFADGAASRPIPADTVARNDPYSDELLTTGKIDGELADFFPFPITRDIMLRGQTLFNAYCSVCHDRSGSANGMVVQNGYASPPLLYEDDVITEPAGFFFDVITTGYSASDNMPSYASQIAIPDRWAIVAYIRALQLSQHATLDDVPPDQRPALEAQP